MKSFLPGLGCLLFFASVHPALAAPAETSPPEYRLTVELRDGSRVVGTGIEKHFRFHSALLGELKLAVKDLRAVECVSSNSARLTTAGGDTLTVWFKDSSFPLKTSFGKIEVAVDSLRKLSVSTVGAGGAHRPGLVALWSGEDSGKDSIGSHDAELSDMTFADGKIGRAFSLNGYSAWANLPASRSLELANADGLTISAWIKPANVNSFHPILEWEVTRQKSAVAFWIGHLPQDHGVLSGTIVDTDGGNHPITSPPGTIVTGQFQHVALTYDKGTGVGRLFVNGRVVAQENIGTVTPDTSGPLFISRRPADQPGDWTYNKFFSGLLDEVAIYNRALSAEEIRAACAEDNNGELPPAPPAGRMMPPWENRDGSF